MIAKKVDFILFKKNDTHYRKLLCNSEWMSMLGEVFYDTGNYVGGIKSELLNLFSKGITGNKIDLIFKGEKVFIEPLYTEDPSEFRIEIDRNQLLQVINDWNEVIKQRPDEIVITKDEGGTITVMGKFNENLS